MAAAYLSAPLPERIGSVFACYKRRYPDRLTAMRKRKNYVEAKGLIQSTNGTLTAYQCLHCGSWHLGHTTKRGN